MESAARQVVPFTEVEVLRAAREVLRTEAEALEAVGERLDAQFCRAVEMVRECCGSVIVTGMGKAGLIGQKIAATLSSTGTRAHFLHPAEAVHGDLGSVGANDLVLALSNSGETDEINRLLPVFRRLHTPVIAVTSSTSSTLGAAAAATISLGKLREAGPHGLAPSTSTTAMVAVGDALALVVSRLKDFTPQQFAVFHPAGSLGRKLSRVDEVMRRGDDLRIAIDSLTIRNVFAAMGKPGRRSGAVMLVDNEGTLTGLFTDSDLARLLEQRREASLDESISAVMTRSPITVEPHDLLGDVVHALSRHKVSELPVVDAHSRPVGLIDITDLIGLIPDAA